MVLLHLSDLHFGNKNRFGEDDPSELGVGFCHAVKTAMKTVEGMDSAGIDLVLVSGDIAESGVPSEFKAAKAFLARLCDSLDLPRDRFVFLPGNHDISWPSCKRVRSELDDQLFLPDELQSRLQIAKLTNYRNFLSEFYGSFVDDENLAGISHARSLGKGGWLRSFPDLHVSVAALNTSEKEDDCVKGGFLGKEQADSLMKIWRDDDLKSYLKIIAVHHNPISTTSANVAWTIDWLRERERQGGGAAVMSHDAFQHFVDDLAGFTGRELLLAVAKDTSAHLVLHGHHHDQGHPVIWPWTKNGGAPVLSVGSFGLAEDQLPGEAPLSCQIINFDISDNRRPNLRAIPLIYDGRFRLEGAVLPGAFRVDVNSRSAYDQPLSLPIGWTGSGPPSSKIDSIETTVTISDPVPKAPDLYAEPPYIGSHSFVGRNTQLESLSEWALPSDSHPVLLYEAIGGTGKSILTWEWVTKHAPSIRADWAGIFWYSFYERGATMVDFCRRALAYMTGRSRSRFKERNTVELTQVLIHHLRDRPWLLVLDGLERVLVSYHRFDAAQVPDDEAGTVDIIADRDPCAAINPEDEDLLRALSGASPSKLLLTTRLVPRVLLNRSGQPIPGVVHDRLPGLRAADAELLLRSCKVHGTSLDIQSYLKKNCDCHPLVIGVLGGLITDYLPDKGNFDSWVADPEGGGKLNLANLDLVQKRNHILSVAFNALPGPGRRLLSTLALLSEAVDYTTLSALNPELSPLPETISFPLNSKLSSRWMKPYSEDHPDIQRQYKNKVLIQTEQADQLMRREEEMRCAAPQLADNIKDLERRGLLQYDSMSRRFDLHPVVRGIAAGGLKNEEKDHYGQRVVDYFSQRSQSPYDQAENLEDFDNARQIVKAMFQMGRTQQAREFIQEGNFLQTLNAKFEAHAEILSIIRPFFAGDWSQTPSLFGARGAVTLSGIAGISLRRIGALNESFAVVENAISIILGEKYFDPLCSRLLSLASTAGELNRLALEYRLLNLAGSIASLKRFKNGNIRYLQLAQFRNYSKLGMFKEADLVWKNVRFDELSSDGLAVASHHFVLNRFFQGVLTADELLDAEGKNRTVSAIGIRNLHALRGFWQLENKNFEDAKSSLQTTIALANRVGKLDRRSEIRLALAKWRLGELIDPEKVIEQFSRDIVESSHRHYAELLFDLGDCSSAIRFAKTAYEWALADGAPYVNWYELKKAHDLLSKLGVEIPAVRQYDVESEMLPIEGLISQKIIEFKEVEDSEVE